MNKEEIKKLFERLFPICRSITGDGLRETLDIIGKHVELNRFKVPSVTRVFDWIVPDEWNIRDAYIDWCGERIVDFKDNNLHVMGYSSSVYGYFSLKQLFSYLYIGESSIPYKTSYYKKDWGFCITKEQYNSLLSCVDVDSKKKFKVVIDADLKPGHLDYGEAIIRGSTGKEFLFSTYCCHPSMANNELSGPILSILIYQYLKSLSNLNYTYRFYFGPETIGTLAYLSEFNRYQRFKNSLVGGLVLTQCADESKIRYKESKEEMSLVNRIFWNLPKAYSMPFTPVGSDERQYNSPGFNLPVGVLGRGIDCDYPEYHTSLDNLEFVDIEKLLEVFELVKGVIYILENNMVYTNITGGFGGPLGEPQLSRYGLYDNESQEGKEAIVWLLNYSDGGTDLLKISDISGLKFKTLVHYAYLLKQKGLLG